MRLGSCCICRNIRAGEGGNQRTVNSLQLKELKPEQQKPREHLKARTVRFCSECSSWPYLKFKQCMSKVLKTDPSLRSRMTKARSAFSYPPFSCNPSYLFVICHLSLAVCCLLFAVCCLLFAVCCLLFAVCCLLFAVRCTLFAER